jgi:hypothetical protein
MSVKTPAPKESIGELGKQRGCLAKLGFVFVVIAVGLWPGWRLIKLGAHHAAAARGVVESIPPGVLCPARDNGPAPALLAPGKTSRGQAAIQNDATRNISVKEGHKSVIAPRVAISKLYLGQDIEDVNQSIRSTKPWKGSGSTWVLRPSGNYDFTEVDLVALLYLFRDQLDKLYPDTAKHIVDTLLVENGSTPRPMVPGSLGLVLETENHVLMTEGARYLKNQWYFERGAPDQLGNPIYDNDRNGLGAWLLNYLRGIQDAGFYEFNSIPYLSYAMRAVLNLEAFPSNDEITATARYILDKANFQYALGSLDLRRCAPFRRQPERAGLTDLQADEHTPLMQVWTCGPADPLPPEPRFRVREEILAETMPYRLPAAVRQWTLEKPEIYFVRFGHGRNGSPELYSGGPNYLISAGGVNRGWRSLIAARPISLLLRDGARDLRDCFHLTGQGHWTKWNNTGVCNRFACSNGALNVPKNKQADASAGHWAVYNESGVMIAVYGAGPVLLAVFPDWKNSPDELLQAISQANPSEPDLAHTFHWPSGGTVEYDVNAPKGTWVIAFIDGKPVDRRYDSWPQMDGDAPKITFVR